MRSGYEFQIRDDLRRRSVDFEYESEVLEYVSTVRGGKCCDCGGTKVGKGRKYTPDFVIVRGDYSKLYIEAKGRLTSTDRSKMRDVKKAHPHLDIRLLFQARYGKAKADVSQWAEKFGFDYAFGIEVPQTWL